MRAATIKAAMIKEMVVLSVMVRIAAQMITVCRNVAIRPSMYALMTIINA